MSDEGYYVCWFCGWPGCNGECESDKICPKCGKDELKPYKDFYCCYACGELVNKLYIKKMYD
jgi:hypothetical protein